MTTHASNHNPPSQSNDQAQTIPAFKPVALPALAAAVRAARQPSTKAKTPAPPAILRKEALLGH